MHLCDEVEWYTHDHFVADLPGLLSYELSNGETAEVVEHLRACETCRRELVEAVAAGYPPEATLPRSFTASSAKTSPSARRLRSSRRTARAPRRGWVRRYRRLSVFVAFVVLGLSVLLSGGSGSEAGADLTPTQRRMALEQAEQADRSERAELLTALRAGTLSFAAVLARSDEVAQNTRIGMIVRALPGVRPGQGGQAAASGRRRR